MTTEFMNPELMNAFEMVEKGEDCIANLNAGGRVRMNNFTIEKVDGALNPFVVSRIEDGKVTQQWGFKSAAYAFHIACEMNDFADVAAFDQMLAETA